MIVKGFGVKKVAKLLKKNGIDIDNSQRTFILSMNFWNELTKIYYQLLLSSTIFTSFSAECSFAFDNQHAKNRL